MVLIDENVYLRQRRIKMNCAKVFLGQDQYWYDCLKAFSGVHVLAVREPIAQAGEILKRYK